MNNKKLKTSSFIFTAKIWKWPGDMGWYFVYVPREYFEPIRTSYGKGMIKITATIGKTSWNTALFPYLRERTYLISVNKKVRKVEELGEGDSGLIYFKIM